jgi:hypothetical protein
MSFNRCFSSHLPLSIYKAISVYYQRMPNLRVTMFCSYNSSEVNNGADKLAEQRTQLLESRRQELVFLDNEIVFNEAIIEERDQGIQEIQHQITEVNEIFKDLAVLVHDQGAMIDDIDSHIENAVVSTSQAKGQLSKAAKTQKSNSSLVISGALCYNELMSLFLFFLRNRILL